MAEVNLRKWLKEGPQFVLAGEFAEADFQLPKMLVRDFFPSAGVGVLYGRGGVGKSLLAMTMAADAMAGGRFLGRFECRKSRVALVQVDTTPLEQQSRLQNVIERPRMSDMGLVISDQRIDILKTLEEKPEWAGTLRAYDADLVIVDSLRKVFSGDENDNRMPSIVYGAWRALLGPKASILFVHHSRKRAQDAFAHIDHKDDARGASAWVDDADFGMCMYEEKKALEADKLWVELTKARTCEEWSGIEVEIDEETLLVGAAN